MEKIGRPVENLQDQLIKRLTDRERLRSWAEGGDLNVREQCADQSPSEAEVRLGLDLFLRIVPQAGRKSEQKNNKASTSHSQMTKS